MAVFNLTDDEIARLRAKFEEFQRDRKRLHEILINYTADYRQFSGNNSERQEYLREKYTPQAPKLSHLIFGDDNEIYWSVADISIVMGRNRSSITRTLANIKKEDGWYSRLLNLRKSAKINNGLSIFVYHQDIFNLIIDHYEEEYLLRFSQPRHGSPDSATDINEVRRFWNYLKVQAELQNKIKDENFAQQELPDLPPMNWKDILNLMWHKLLDVRLGMLLSILFIASFELVKRWPDVLPFIITASTLIFISCFILIKFRAKNPNFLAASGAGAFLFALVWGIGIFSSDGTIRTPAGVTLTFREPESKISLEPVLYGDNGQINFHIISDLKNAKEFLYRISPDINYKSTGFYPQNNKSEQDMPLSPQLTIINTKLAGIICLDIKYIDKNDKEHEPLTFSFNLDDERFKLRKKFILNQTAPWVNTYRLERLNTTFFMTAPIFYSSAADETVKALVYGLNTDQPDITLTQKSIRALEEPFQILMTENNNIKYVTSYILFNDGTSSDIRRDDL